METVFNPNEINILLSNTKQHWEHVHKKKHTLFATQLPKGYVFANLIEQPDTCEMLQKTYGNLIVPKSEVSDDILAMPHYESDGRSITMCGTRYELWQISYDEYLMNYRRMSPGQNNTWMKCIPNVLDTNEIAFQVPNVCQGVLVMKDGSRVPVNMPKVTGHNSGDIIVTRLINDAPDLFGAYVVNNDVFYNTYDTSESAMYFTSSVREPVATEAGVVRRYGITYEQLLYFATRMPKVEKAFLMNGIVDREDMETWCLLNIPSTVKSYDEVCSIVETALNRTC